MTKIYQNKQVNDLLSKFPVSRENEKATKRLLKNFPEFKNSKFYGQTDDSIPYLVFADFCQYLIDRISTEAKVKDDELFIRFSKFISELYESGNKDLKDLVLTGIFENLAEDGKTKRLLGVLSRKTGEEFKKFFS